MGQSNRGGHEWYIEFIRPPEDIRVFEDLLDKALQSVNSDYEAKRQHDMALSNLKVHQLRKGTFDDWLKSKGKIGGQTKVPRLMNDRSILEAIQAIEKSGIQSFR
jgi:hypothetical protein